MGLLDKTNFEPSFYRHIPPKMKTITCFVVTVLFGCVAFAAGKPNQESGQAQTQPDPQWNVRVEVLMAAMPQANALALLPDLRDPAKIEGAVNEILKAIDHNEGTLMGYPVVQTLDGDRGVAEDISELIYPTEFDPPMVPSTVTLPTAITGTADNYAIPTAFETRNVGSTLEVEPRVIGNGEWISLNLVPQLVQFICFDSYKSGKAMDGKPLTVDQPRFFTTRATMSLKVRNGQRCLIGVFKLVVPANNLEFFILQAIATRVGK